MIIYWPPQQWTLEAGFWPTSQVVYYAYTKESRHSASIFANCARKHQVSLSVSTSYWFPL